MQRKKILVLLLTVFFCLSSLTACKQDKVEHLEHSQNHEIISQAEFSYELQLLPIVLDGQRIKYISDYIICEPTAYLIAGIEQTAGGSAEDTPVEEVLLSLNLNTGEAVKLSYTAPPAGKNLEGGFRAAAIAADLNGALWLLGNWNTYRYDLPEGVSKDAEEAGTYCTVVADTTLLLQLDKTGKVEQTIKLEVPEGTYLQALFFDDQAHMIAAGDEEIYVCTMKGKILFSLPNEQGSPFCQLAPDKIGCTCWSEELGTPVFRALDIDKRALEDEMLWPENASAVFGGFHDYDYLYVSDDAMFAHNEKTDKQEKLLSFDQYGLKSADMEQAGVRILQDGRIIALKAEYNHEAHDMRYALAVLTPAERSKKEVLTLGCINLNKNLRAMVADFNRTHADAYIEVLDYGQRIQGENSQWDAVQALHTDILSGHVPDLLQTNLLPVERYAAQGVLMDLWPMIDSDPELKREDLLEHFFETLSVDHKLFLAAPSFTIVTASTNRQIAGDKTSWTLDEMQQALEGLGPDAVVFGEDDCEETMLHQCLSFDLDQYIDRQDKSCHFDCPEFVELLEFVHTFPSKEELEECTASEAESTYSRLNSGRQLLKECSIGSLRDVQEENLFQQGDAVFIGYPSVSGHGNAFQIESALAISAETSHPDLAWSFVRELLLEESQTENNVYGLPTNRHAFENKMQSAMAAEYQTDPETGEKTEVSPMSIDFGDGMIVDLYSATQKDYDKLSDLYYSCNTVVTNENQIMRLIAEECGAFFANQKTVQETAQMIQNRVGLYILEQD